MRRLVVGTLMVGLVLMDTCLVLAHPHFDKNIVVKLPSGVQLTVAYNTTPANELHATNTPVNQFVTPRGPRITLSGELKAGNVTIPAGEYTIGMIKTGNTDWTLALLPGRPGRGAVDMGKVIKLDSMFASNMGDADHMLIDVTPGKGKFEGKAVLTVHFGNLFLAGALS